MFSDIFNISHCNVAQLIGEANRFLFHGFLLHISTCVINKDYDFFSKDLFKTLTIIMMAVILYHLVIRKIVEPPLKKMKIICRRRQKVFKNKDTNTNTDGVVSQG